MSKQTWNYIPALQVSWWTTYNSEELTLDKWHGPDDVIGSDTLTIIRPVHQMDHFVRTYIHSYGQQVHNNMSQATFVPSTKKESLL